MTGKCTLCGGRIVNGRCEFCGLSCAVSRREQLKKINIEKKGENIPDLKADIKNSLAKIEAAGKTSGNRAKKKKTDTHNVAKKIIAVVSAGIVILAVVPPLFEVGKTMLDSLKNSGVFTMTDETAVDDYDPYEFVTREIPAEGSEYSGIFDSGVYRIGVHIPEGEYLVELVDGDGSMFVQDAENGIYDMTFFGENAEYDELTEKAGILLYNGAQITIDTNAVLRFITSNAQTFAAQTAENPITETVAIKEGSYVVGEGDIPEGIFDICIDGINEYDYSNVHLLYPNGESYYFWLDYVPGESSWSEYDKGRIQNVVLTKGTAVEITDTGVRLEPAQGYYDVDFENYPQ